MTSLSLVLISLCLTACGLRINIDENSSSSPAPSPSPSPTPQPTVSFSSSAQSLSESGGAMTITVSLSSAAMATVTVPFSIDAGVSTAINTTDFSFSPASPLTFNIGETSKTITVTVVNDVLDEGNETIVFNLGTPTNATLGTTPTHTATILDDDHPCDATVTGGYGGGSGTVGSPYTICSLAQWNYLASTSADWNKNFKLYSDLDFTGVTLANFKSIGDSGTAFTGSFDGNNYRIHDVSLTGTTETIALFKKTDQSVTIKNLSLENIDITSQGGVGGLVHTHGSGGTLTFDHISMTNVNLHPTGSSTMAVGGLVSTSNGALSIHDIQLNNIRLYDANLDSAGSLVGKANGAVTVSTVAGQAIAINESLNDGDRLGGLIGDVITFTPATFSLTDVTLTNVKVHGGATAGSIVGEFWTSTNAFTRVRVSSGNVFAYTSGGGLFGRNFPLSASTLSMTESSFEGTVYGTGGLGGEFSGAITVSKSYTKGTVTIWDTGIGGLFGQIGNSGVTSTITDSYSAAAVYTTHASAGSTSGLVNSLAGTVQFVRSYFSGSSNANAGSAYCITNTSGASSFAATDVYYDSTVCTKTAGDSGSITGATGLATASFQTATPFTNWNTTDWIFTSGQNPKLSWEP